MKQPKKTVKKTVKETPSKKKTKPAKTKKSVKVRTPFSDEEEEETQDW